MRFLSFERSLWVILFSAAKVHHVHKLLIIRTVLSTFNRCLSSFYECNSQFWWQRFCLNGFDGKAHFAAFQHKTNFQEFPAKVEAWSAWKRFGASDFGWNIQPCSISVSSCTASNFVEFQKVQGGPIACFYICHRNFVLRVHWKKSCHASRPFEWFK